MEKWKTVRSSQFPVSSSLFAAERSDVLSEAKDLGQQLAVGNSGTMDDWKIGRLDDWTIGRLDVWMFGCLDAGCLKPSFPASLLPRFPASPPPSFHAFRNKHCKIMN